MDAAAGIAAPGDGFIRRALAIGIPLMLGGGAAGAATLSIVDQERRAGTDVLVFDGATTDFASDSDIAPDLGPFDAEVLSEASLPSIAATVLVTQTSTLGSASFDAQGSATSTTTGQGTASALGSSEVTLRFSLDQDAPYSVQGFVEGFDGGSASVTLSQSFVPVFTFTGTNGRLAIDQQGMLPAGDYEYALEGHVVGGAPVPPDTTESQSAAYDVLFVASAATQAVAAALPVARIEAFPNPFRTRTRLVVPAGVARVAIVDAGGRRVRALTAAPTLDFDGRDDAGRPLPSGVYWAVPLGEPRVERAKIVRIR